MRSISLSCVGISCQLHSFSVFANSFLSFFYFNISPDQPFKYASYQDILQEMRSQSIKPDRTTYNTLLDMCEAKSDSETAKHVFQQMQADSIQPDDHTWNTLLALHANQNDLGCVRALLEEVIAHAKVKIDLSTYSAIIQACMLASPPEKSSSQAEEAKKIIKMVTAITAKFKK